MRPIILASTSPRRKQLLKQIGVPFKSVDSKYPEDDDLECNLSPTQLAIRLSFKKAEAVSKRYKNALIIGADTLGVLGKELLRKVYTSKEALEMLTKMNGKTITVITGFTIIDTEKNKVLSKAVKTKVFMRKLSMKELQAYVKTKEPLRKAGAFAIQGKGALLVKKVEGDYSNVMGLPLETFVEALKKFGVFVL